MGMKWPSLSAGVETRGVSVGERPSVEEAGDGEMPAPPTHHQPQGVALPRLVQVW